MIFVVFVFRYRVIKIKYTYMLILMFRLFYCPVKNISAHTQISFGIVPLVLIWVIVHKYLFPCQVSAFVIHFRPDAGRLNKARLARFR